MYRDRVMSETKKIKKVFTPEFKERAVRMVAEIREVPGEGYGAITRVSNQLGISKPESTEIYWKMGFGAYF